MLESKFFNTVYCSSGLENLFKRLSIEITRYNFATSAFTATFHILDTMNTETNNNLHILYTETGYITHKSFIHILKQTFDKCTIFLDI